MAKVKFVPNASGFREILHSPELADYLMTKADAVAAVARSTAPVDSGDYQGSIGTRQVDHPTRVVAQVYASDWKAHIVEANTGNLARALDAAGG